MLNNILNLLIAYTLSHLTVWVRLHKIITRVKVILRRVLYSSNGCFVVSVLNNKIIIKYPGHILCYLYPFFGICKCV